MVRKGGEKKNYMCKLAYYFHLVGLSYSRNTGYWYLYYWIAIYSSTSTYRKSFSFKKKTKRKALGILNPFFFLDLRFCKVYDTCFIIYISLVNINILKLAN